MPKKNEDNYYIDKREFHLLLVEHKKKVTAALKRGEEPPQPCDGIGESFIKIANGLASKSNFANYIFREDMVGDAIENCSMAVNKYDPDRFNNPYGYFTKVCWWSNLRKIEREHKQLYIKFKSMERAILGTALVEGDDENFQYDDVLLDNEKMNHIIEKFDNKSKKKPKAK
jgi:hypothetical protein